MRPLLAFDLILLVSAPIAVRAQQLGALRGTVTDATTQRPVPGVTIEMDSTHRLAITDSAGGFRFGSVSEGLHYIAAHRLGFRPDRLVNLRVTREKTTVADISLQAVAVQLEASRSDASALGRDPEAPVGRFDYTAEEIRRTPGAASDLFRAIETLPGVSSSGGEFSAFSVRGGGPRNNLFFIDDIPFDKVTHLEGGIESDEAQGGRFSIFAPDLVHSAVFQAGGFDATYGGKDASLLSLRLKEGNAETPTYGGRYDLLGWEADYDGPSRIDPHTTLLFSARHENFGEALKIIGREDAGTPDFTDVIFKSATTINSRNKITVLGIMSPEQVTRTVANILTESDTNDAALYAWRETKGVAGVSWRLLAGKASVIQTSTYLRRFTRHNALGEAYPDQPIDGGASIASRPYVRTDDRSETEIGARSVARLSSGANALLLSAEAAGNKLGGGRSVSGADTLYTFDQYDMRPAPTDYFVVISPQNYDARFARRGTRAAGSASYERSFGGDGRLIAGGRYEHSGVTGRDDVVPRASIAFPIIGGVAFSLAGGVYLQDPDLQVIAANPQNALLPPERSTHLIAGVSHLLKPDMQLTVETYYRTLSDVAVLASHTTGLEEATGTGFASGVDIDLVRRLTDRFFGQASYSYSVSKRNDNRGAPTYNGDGNRPHSANLLAGYTLNSTWSFSGKFKYATGSPTDDYIIHSDVLPGSGLVRYSREITLHNARRFPDLHSLNVRVDYQRQVRAVGIDAFLDVLDAYNHLNVNNIRLDERTGRTVFDGVRTVPTFGLKLLF